MERTGGDTQRGRLSPSSRYEVLVRIAAGGMATVYVGRLGGAHGFSRLVAVKRAHAHLLLDRSFRRMLIGEARIAARIHHPNVVSVVDIEDLDGELLLVMDYVEGASLSELTQAAAAAKTPLPAGVALRIAVDACNGLHAAHELCDESGKPLKLVHRDVSPQNILVGIDGLARIADFGIAKSVSLSSTANTLTETGALKGKLAYMAPEYVQGETIDARADVFAMGVVAWEILTRQRLFRGPNEAETLGRVVRLEAPPVSSVVPGLGADLDAAVAMALVKAPAARFASAGAFAQALEIAAQRAGALASHAEVARLVKALIGPSLEARRAKVRDRLAPELQVEATAQEAEKQTAALDPDLLPTRAMPAQKAPLPVEPAPAVTEVVAEASTLGGSNSHATVTPDLAAPRTGRGWLRPMVVAVVVARAARTPPRPAPRGARAHRPPPPPPPPAAVVRGAPPAPPTAAAPPTPAGDPGAQPGTSPVPTASASARDLAPRATAATTPPSIAATGPAPRSTSSSRPPPSSRPPLPSTATAEPVGPRIRDNPY